MEQDDFDFELSEDDEMALVGQAIIDKDLSGIKKQMTEAFREAIKHETATYYGRPLDSIGKGFDDFGEAIATTTKKVKAVSGAFSGIVGNTRNDSYHDEDWRWEHDKSKTEESAFEKDRQRRADEILDTILPEMEEILNTQKKAVVSAANQFITKAVADVESRFELKYGKRIKELEEKLELMVAMQNPNFGRF